MLFFIQASSEVRESDGYCSVSGREEREGP